MMRITEKDIRIKRVLIFLLSVILLFTSMVPMNIATVEATGTVTVYFDTGGGFPSGYGWSKDMSQVCCIATSSKDSNDNGKTGLAFTESSKMTKTNLESVKDPGKGSIFKMVFSASDVGKYLSFSPYCDSSIKQKGYYRTARRDGVQVKDNILVFLTNNEQDGYWQSWYRTMPTIVTDYAGKNFKIANLTSDSVTFDLVFYSEDGTNVKTLENQFVPARNLGKQFTVPSVADGHSPYTGVRYIRKKIGDTVDSSNTLIKNYTFSSGKCIDKTLKYGITQYADTSDYVDDADGKTLSFYGDDYATIPAVSSKKLYLAKEGFSDYGDAGNITVVIGGVEYPVESLAAGGQAPSAASGNASYATKDDVSVAQNEIFTIKCKRSEGKYDLYNLVWNESDKDLCVLASGDTAQITDTRNVQGFNEMPNGQKYITVKSDFFDYQYDDFNYTYRKVNFPGKDSNADWTVDSSASTRENQKANAKRPYVAINEAISNSAYATASGAIPMYLGQFWMPLYDDVDTFYDQHKPFSDESYSTSSKVYVSSMIPRSGHNYPSDMYASSGGDGKQYDGHLGFGNTLNNFKWGANLAYRTDSQATGTYMPYDAVAQGLVGDYLQDESGNNTKTGKLMAKNSSAGNLITVPYFDKTWWENTNVTPSQTGTSVNMSKYLKTYTNLDFPFFEIDASKVKFKNDYNAQAHLLSDTTDKYAGKYYVFDSMNYSVRVVEDGTDKYHLEKYNTSDKLVYDNYGSDGWSEDTSHGREYGFFPFNDPSSGSYHNRADLHYGFGVRYDIDFYMTSTGTVDDDPNGTPITFTFQGDDDVWVFLDGKLLLDMGGAHKNALGEINFKTKKTWISAIGQATTSSIVSNNTDTNKREQNDSVIKRNRGDVTKSFADWTEYLTEGEHTITMFYMERGMLNSNLYCMFNLPTNITSLQIQEDTDFGNVNGGFLDATRYVADSDIFNYTVENKGTTDVLGSAYSNPSSEAVTRTNGDSSTGLNLVADTVPTVCPSGRIYIDPGVWDTDGAAYACLFMDNNSGSVSNMKLVNAKYDKKIGMYYVDKEDGYSYIRWYRFPTAPTEYEGKTKWSIVDAKWNRTGDISIGSITSSNNTVKITGWDTSTISGSAASAYNSVYKYVGEHTYNFKKDVAADDDGFQPLVSSADKKNGITYQLKDMFAAAPVVYDTRMYDSGGNSNIVSLQYGEMATISKQVSAMTNMRVTQLDTLSAPVSGARVEKDGEGKIVGTYNDVAGRTVSKYYTTYVKSQENEGKLQMLPSAGIYKVDDVSGIVLSDARTMYESASGSDYVLKDSLTGKNYSNNTVVNLQKSGNGDDIVTTYMISDPNKASNTNVALRQVIINSVKTADLRLAKYMTSVDVDKAFTFTISFTQVFGDSSDAAVNKINTSLIKYSLDDAAAEYTFGSGSGVSYSNASGNKSVTFTLHPNHSITIKGIPVGTVYKIEEAEDTEYVIDANSSRNLTFDADGKVASQEIVENMDIDWFNKRKTGAIRLRKMLFDGSQEITSTESFEFKATFTAPSGAGSIASYPVNYHIASTPADVQPIQWTRNGEEDNYTYSINIYISPTELANGDDVIIEGFPVGSTYTVDESVKGKYNKEIIYSDSTKTVDDYYNNASLDDTIDLVTIKNTRKKGDLRIIDLGYDTAGIADGDVNYTDAAGVVDTNAVRNDCEDNFGIRVKLTVPDGVTLSNYISTDGWSVSGNVYTKDFSQKLNDLLEINGLPFDTQYEVEQISTGADYSQHGDTIYTTGKRNDAGDATLLKTSSIGIYKIDHETVPTTAPADLVVIKNILPVVIVMPTTGAAAPAAALYFGGGMLVVAAGVLMVILKKKVMK